MIHCEKLEGKLAQLDKIRQKQAKKITSLKDEMGVSDAGSEERLGKAEHAIQALSSELKTTKNLLDDTGKRERQVSISSAMSKDVVIMLLGRSIEHTRAHPTMHNLEFQNSVKEYLFKFQNCTVKMSSKCPLRIYIHFYAIVVFRVS